MLNWSNSAYKFTLGIGSLAMIGMMAELWSDVLPVWAAIGIVLAPLFAFVFVRPGEVPEKFVRFAQVGASVWYISVGTICLAAWFAVVPLPKAWPVLPALLLVGLIPCVLVLVRNSNRASELDADLPPVRTGADQERELRHSIGMCAGDREYEYRPKWLMIFFCAAFFGLCAVVLGYEALINDGGLVINGLIKLSPEQATFFYWGLCAMSVLFVAVAGLMCAIRLCMRQRIALTAEGLIVPKSGLSSTEKLIRYGDISDMSVSSVYSEQFLSVTWTDGKHAVMASMLPSKAAFEEVCELLAAEVRKAKESKNSFRR